MKTWFDLAASVSRTHVTAMWSMRPPLVSVETLIVVVLVCCVLLFWVRSSIELKQQMYDRLYGPGVRTANLEWWEADLDPAFKRSVSKLAQKWMKR